MFHFNEAVCRGVILSPTDAENVLVKLELSLSPCLKRFKVKYCEKEFKSKVGSRKTLFHRDERRMEVSSVLDYKSELLRGDFQLTSTDMNTVHDR